MEVVSGLASASQLLAYCHSTFQVLIKLYKQVKDGPAALKQRQNSIRVLLTAVESLHKRPVPAHILDTLSGLANLAHQAHQLIVQSQAKGAWGLRWGAIRNDSLLSEVFTSLRDYRDILNFAIAVDTRDSTGRVQDSLEDMAFGRRKVS
jgi:hypothetical protein